MIPGGEVYFLIITAGRHDPGLQSLNLAIDLENHRWNDIFALNTFTQ